MSAPEIYWEAVIIEGFFLIPGLILNVQETLQDRHVRVCTQVFHKFLIVFDTF